MKIFIEPNDVLMFRDGKPFSGGDDHYARGVFPPFPSTFYGALRSKILSDRYPEFERYAQGDVPEDLKDVIGSPDSPGRLTITNFLLGQQVPSGAVEPLFPVPRDVLGRKGAKGGPYTIVVPLEGACESFTSNLPLPSLLPLWHRDTGVLESVEGFMRREEMEAYLTGRPPGELLRTDAPSDEGGDKGSSHRRLYQTEERVGIRKGRETRAAAAGALYSVDYFRLRSGAGFLVDVEGAETFPTEGLLRLGGDHRSAFFRACDSSMPDPTKVKAASERGNRFKLVLLTPAVFDKGWLPAWVDPESGLGRHGNLRLRLTGAAVGKPVSVGGFDLVRRAPKDMRKAVPVGSVFFFELQEGTWDEVFTSFWLARVSEERAHEGFGISIIGGY